MIKKIILMALVGLSPMLYAMNEPSRFNIPENLYRHYDMYADALKRRFDDKRVMTNKGMVWMETVTDYTPVIGVALAVSGGSNLLVDKIPYMQPSTKKVVAQSLKRALIFNGVYSAASLLVPAQGYHKYNGFLVMPNSPYNPDGLSKVSSLVTSAIVGAMYMGLDLMVQSDVVPNGLKKVPHYTQAGDFVNKHVAIGQGTGTELLKFAAVCAIRSFS